MRVYLYLLSSGLTCMWLYALSTRITLHGGAWKMAKMGESQTGSVSFLSWGKIILEFFVIVRKRSTLKFSFTSGDFLLLIPPYLFTVHIRPVLSPYQAGNTCCILSCFFKYVYNIVNTICTHNMYIALCLAPLFLFGITGFCLTFYCTNIVL